MTISWESEKEGGRFFTYIELLFEVRRYNSSQSVPQWGDSGPMLSLHVFLPKVRAIRFSGLVMFLMVMGWWLAVAAAQSLANPQASAPQTQSPEPPAIPPPPPYDPAIFQKRIPADQLSFLNQFAGQPSEDLFRDKQFHKLMKSFVPDGMFHYGSDMPLDDALERVFTKSRDPVLIRDGRYVVLSGENGPYLGGRGLLWIDMQEGIGLGAFYFHPTNGEPTPALTVFSRQVREKTLQMTQLPPAFAEDLILWAGQARVAPVTTRYFISGLNKRILLEHNEDYCASVAGYPPPPPDVCEQMTADAADLDATAAYYLDQIHYATNGTAWMIGQDQMAWIQMRNSTCGAGPDPLGCRIRISRERTNVIIHHGAPVAHPPPHR